MLGSGVGWEGEEDVAQGGLRMGQHGKVATHTGRGSLGERPQLIGVSKNNYAPVMFCCHRKEPGTRLVVGAVKWLTKICSGCL